MQQMQKAIPCEMAFLFNEYFSYAVFSRIYFALQAILVTEEAIRLL